ncbi:uncharacterized membrane protein At3g27390-like isoform X2 [Magnolia sinica]|uniref:uncharacterized membrane protein At3g27390-like isoform X2 n=1 Tax=Magnolia sinica TaxID=86752 RepID=UPI00265A73F1|nr:uncharacterized membrane protein At3g27390-like isoform X2 [Magnolia sinica]
MEPPSGFWATCWRFLFFLPFFLGLLLLGIIKGVIFCPLVCLIMTIGNSAVILGLWPAHVFWTYYCIARAKQLGPLLKVTMCICVTVLLVLWPFVGIIGSILAGAGYGLFSPLIATFDAVGEGKPNDFIHCILNGTWSTVKRSCTVVRDFTDVCFHSYFSIMKDIRNQEPVNGKLYEIRLFHLLGALLVGAVGAMVDVPVITAVALCKSPFMLFKGWHRLFHDLIGREGPFLETACVPFAGLAILLWPLAVVGAVMASALSSFFLGAYAAVVVYQESSILFGFNYVISSFALFDEYSNDILDMPEGSCFPRRQYRKENSSRSTSFSRPLSFRNERPDGKAPPSRSTSFTNSMVEFKTFELLDRLFEECKQHGRNLVAEGLITPKDIEDYNHSKSGSRIISIGLPACCILEALLRSAQANCDGLLLSDKTTVISSVNRPKEPIFGFFFDPLMIMKEQIKVEALSDAEAGYLRKLVLLNGDPERLKSCTIGLPPETDRKRAEVDALARRLQGITKSISRYPTFRRRIETLVSYLSEECMKKDGSVNGSRSTARSRSGLGRMLSQKSFGSKGSTRNTNEEIQLVAANQSEFRGSANQSQVIGSQNV